MRRLRQTGRIAAVVVGVVASVRQTDWIDVVVAALVLLLLRKGLAVAAVAGSVRTYPAAVLAAAEAVLPRPYP